MQPDDFDETEEAGEVVAGSATTVDASEVAGLILEMICGATKLVVLLHEIDAEGWAMIKGRLGTFRAIVEQTPTEGPAARRVGFAVAGSGEA